MLDSGYEVENWIEVTGDNRTQQKYMNIYTPFLQAPKRRQAKPSHTQFFSISSLTPSLLYCTTATATATVSITVAKLLFHLINSMPAQKRPAGTTTPPPSPPPPLKEEKVDDAVQDSENHNHEQTVNAGGTCSDAYSCIRIRTSSIVGFQ